MTFYPNTSFFVFIGTVAFFFFIGVIAIAFFVMFLHINRNLKEVVKLLKGGK